MEIGRIGVAKAFGESAEKAYDEAAHVSPPGGAAAFGAVSIERAHSAGELDQKPPADQDERGNADARPEQENSGEDAAVREEEEESGHDAGNGSAGADAGKMRGAGKGCLGDGGSQPGGKIKASVGKMSEMVFDIAAENPQEPHIADDVEPSSVKKYGSEDRNERVQQGAGTIDACDEVGRDQAVGHKEVADARRRQGEFVREDGSVDGDKDHGNGGEGVAAVEIFEREHEFSAAAKF